HHMADSELRPPVVVELRRQHHTLGHEFRAKERPQPWRVAGHRRSRIEGMIVWPIQIHRLRWQATYHLDNPPLLYHPQRTGLTAKGRREMGTKSLPRVRIHSGVV